MRLLGRAVHAALLTGLALTGQVALPLAASAEVGSSPTYLTVAPGFGLTDWWRPLDRTWRPGDNVATTVTPGSIEVAAQKGSVDGLTLSLSAATGSLTVGEYGTGCAGCLPGSLSVDYYAASAKCAATGRFQVHTADAEAERYWITYQAACQGKVMFGEVRHNLPEEPAPVQVLGRRTVFPEREVGHVAGRALVQIRNTGSEPLAITSATVQGGAEFTVPTIYCDAVEAGSTCSIPVSFTPSAPGAQAATLALTTSAGELSVDLTGRGIGGTNAWTTYAEYANPVRSGETHKATPANSLFRVQGDRTGLSADSSKGAVAFRITDCAAIGAGSGTCDNTLEMLDTSCQAGTHRSKVTVLESTFDGDILTGLAMTYRHQCNGSAKSEYGTITWRATTVAPLPGVVGARPDGVRNLTVVPNANTAELKWTKPRAPDWAAVEVRVASGTTPPKDRKSGTLVYSGRAEKATFTSMKPGLAYAYSIFTVDSEPTPLVSAPVTHVLRASSLTLKVSTKSLSYGGKVKLTGKLSAPGIGDGSQKVEIYAQRPDTKQWYTVKTVTTAGDGSFSTTWAPGYTYDFLALFRGSSAIRVGGDESAKVRVSLKRKAYIGVDKYKARSGSTFSIYTAADPMESGKTLTLQKLVNGTWKNVATGKSSATKATTFKVKPTARGNHAYRVVTSKGGGLEAGTSKRLTITVT